MYQRLVPLHHDEKCVPRSWMCDETNNCSDCSDETECNYNRNSRPLSHTYYSPEFRCLSGECLPLKRACDRNPDCIYLSDKDFESCSSACLSSQYLVEQTCRPIPQGPVCRCKPGFALSPDGLCEDANECNLLSSCAQVCTNTKGSYKCHCRYQCNRRDRLKKRTDKMRNVKTEAGMNNGDDANTNLSLIESRDLNELQTSNLGESVTKEGLSPENIPETPEEASLDSEDEDEEEDYLEECVGKRIIKQVYSLRSSGCVLFTKITHVSLNSGHPRTVGDSCRSLAQDLKSPV